MTYYNKIKQKLEQFPQFRERRLRNKYLAVMAMRETGMDKEAKLDMGYTDFNLKCLDDFVDFAITFDSLRHAWGDVTRECKELRGTDYDDGKYLSQEKQIQLGYEVGFNQDRKLIKRI